jgi:enoyl-[acyl-carrier protein] reductase III
MMDDRRRQIMEGDNSSRGRKDRWALILGASSGFGAATAIELARRGFHIAGVHLDRKTTLPNVEQIISKIKGMGQEAIFFNVNAADAGKRREVLDQMESQIGKPPEAVKVQVLMHSLAFGTLKPFIAESLEETISQAQMEMTLDVMANSLVYWTQDLVRRQFLQRGSRIFAMTSAGGQRVWPTYGAVSAAKAALESHIRQLALELGAIGITINAIRAGVTDTPALRKIPGHEQMIEMARKRNPGGRLTTPQDIAAVIGILSDPNSQWMTGNVIGVDGGEFIVD